MVHLVPNVQTLAGHAVSSIPLAPTTIHTLHFDTVLKTKPLILRWIFFYFLLNSLKMNFGTLCHIVKVWRYGPFNEEECRGAFFAVCCQSPFFVENL